MATHLHRLILYIHLIQVCGGDYTYCQEAVETVKSVQSCPSSKLEWDRAANKKNCEEKAARQGCTTSEKFVYHCVKNGLNYGLVEVCAPLRLILGNCAEFNIAGGVIQDLESVPCTPKCASFYNSSDAYKYPVCYKLPGHTPRFPPDNAPNTNRGTLIIILTVSLGCLISISVVIAVFVLYKRVFNGARYPCTRQNSTNTNVTLSSYVTSENGNFNFPETSYEAGQIFERPSDIQMDISTISSRENFRHFDANVSKESLASSNDSAENRTKRLIQTNDYMYLKSSQTSKATTSDGSTDEFFDAQS